MKSVRIGLCFIITVCAWLPPLYGDPAADFRKTLATAGPDLRVGLFLDVTKLRSRIETWEDANSRFLYDKVREGLTGLPTGPRRAPEGRVVFTVVESDLLWLLPSVRRTLAMSTDIRWLTRTVLMQETGMKLNQDFAMSAEKAAGWLEFLSLAEPAWTVNAVTADTILLTADYGGQDWFVFDFQYKDKLWRPVKMEWRQRLPDMKEAN